MRRLRLAALGAVVPLVLASCSGSEDAAVPTPSAATAQLPAGYPTGAPTTVSYTEPGTEIGLGESATVAWTATGIPKSAAAAPGTVVLRMAVTAITRTTFKESFQDWKVAEDLAGYTPYFVRVSIANVGEGNLAGADVPLYGRTSADTLLEPSRFASTFKPCTPNTFPRPFATTQVAQLCLVYLVPDGGTLTGVTFRPNEEFRPISWVPTPAPQAQTPQTSQASPTPAAPESIGATASPSATMGQ